MKWTNIYRGILMGITELIPGVSSGTLALLMGIYEQLLNSIKGLVLNDFIRSIRFLLPLGIGMAIAILLLSNVVTYLLAHHQIPTQWTFIGLVIGVLPMLMRVSKFRRTFNGIHYGVIILALVFIVLLSLVTPSETLAHSDMTGFQYVKLFFAGMLATMTLLLPGISGSLVLLILGYYYVVVGSISELTSLNFSVLPVLIIAGAGMALGLFVGSVVITYVFKRLPYVTYAFIIGLVAGSVIAIYPGLPTSGTMWVWTIGMTVVGFVLSFALGIAGESEQKNQESKMKRGANIV